MKIAVVTNFFPPEAIGGAEIFAYDLCAELARRGLRVDVFTTSHGKTRVERQDGMSVHFFRSEPPLPRLTSDLLGYNFNPFGRSMTRELQRGDHDIIHLHNINSSIMMYPLLLSFRAPVISHIHDHWPICYRGILYDPSKMEACSRIQTSCCFDRGHRLVGSLNLALRAKLMRRFESAVTSFVSPSKYMKDALLNRGFSTREKIEVIPLGINMGNLPRPRLHRTHRFIYAGRMVYYKNPKFVFDLAARKSIPRTAKFVLVGGGPELVSLRSSLSTGIPRIELLGLRSRTQTVQEISESRGLIVPSLIHENSPLVVHEALATGTPVLCTPLGGPAELVRGSGAGGVIPLDRLDLWDEWLQRLTDDEGFVRLSSHATAFAEKHLSIENAGQAMIALYDRALVK